MLVSDWSGGGNGVLVARASRPWARPARWFTSVRTDWPPHRLRQGRTTHARQSRRLSLRLPEPPAYALSRPPVRPTPSGRGPLRLAQPLRALASVRVPTVRPSRIRLPASLRSVPVTALHRYCGPSDSCPALHRRTGLPASRARPSDLPTARQATPPRGGAVAVGYRPESAYLETILTSPTMHARRRTGTGILPVVSRPGWPCHARTRDLDRALLFPRWPSQALCVSAACGNASRF